MITTITTRLEFHWLSSSQLWKLQLFCHRSWWLLNWQKTRDKGWVWWIDFLTTFFRWCVTEMMFIFEALMASNYHHHIPNERIIGWTNEPSKWPLIGTLMFVTTLTSFWLIPCLLPSIVFGFSNIPDIHHPIHSFLPTEQERRRLWRGFEGWTVVMILAMFTGKSLDLWTVQSMPVSVLLW